MTEILFIKKQDQTKLSIEEVVKGFNESDNLEDIKAMVEKAADRMYVSWASVDAKDKAGERIPIADIVKNQETLITKRGGPITDEHSNNVVGKTWAYKVLEHPKSRTMGVLHLNQIFADNVKDDEVWKGILSGKKTGSSVGGLTEDKKTFEVESTGGVTTVLNGFKQFETSIVENPCNPFATNEGFSVIAKSVSGAPASETTKMVEEKNVAAVTKQDENDMTSEAPEVSLDDVITLVQQLAQRMDEIEALISAKPEAEEEAEVSTPDEEAKADEPEAEAEEEKSEEESEEETAKADEEEEKSEEESEDTEDLKAEIAELKKSHAELVKKFSAVKVISATRPLSSVKKAVEKEEKKAISALDIVRGKATLDEALEARYKV
jgi:hypothetical protein